MTKLAAFIFSLPVLVFGCTKEQRSGWEQRLEALTGAPEQTAAADTLSPEDFSLDAARQQLIGLRTGAARREWIENVIELPGETAADPDRDVEIEAPIQGRITELAVRLGDAVAQGARLAVIENPQSLGQKMVLRSPLKGVVIERPVSAGEWVQAGEKLASVADYTALHAVIHAYPEELAQLRLGQRVRVFSDSAVAMGSILFISPATDPATRTVEVRAAVANPALRFSANAYVRAQVVLGRKQAIVVPDSAVLPDESREIVYVQEGKRFLKRVVRTGWRQSGLVEIIAGLREGDVVVTAGAFQLKNINFTSSSGEEDMD